MGTNINVVLIIAFICTVILYEINYWNLLEYIDEISKIYHFEIRNAKEIVDAYVDNSIKLNKIIKDQNIKILDQWKRQQKHIYKNTKPFVNDIYHWQWQWQYMPTTERKNLIRHRINQYKQNGPLNLP